MNRRTALFSHLALALTIPATCSHAAPAKPPMPLAEVISAIVLLVPGSPTPIQSLFDAHLAAPTLGQYGWHHAPFDYRTKEGALLHIQLISDWQNRAAPAVVRLVATVDDRTCVDAAAIQRTLAQRSDMTWTSAGPNQGWTGQGAAHVVGLGQRYTRCLAVFTIDNRLQPRPSPPTRALRVDPSGRVTPVPIPGQ